MMENRRFIYWDSSGISTAYSSLEKLRDIEPKENNLRAIAKDILRSVFSSAVWDINSAKSACRKEPKLAEVEKTIKELGFLLEIDNGKVLSKLPSDRLPIFVTGETRFSSRSTRYLQGSESCPNPLQFAAFELDQSSQMEDWSAWPHVDMGASLSKFYGTEITDSGKWRFSSFELRLLLQYMTTSSFPLGFWGLADQTFETLYIKPYAIWLPERPW